jgi:hypothetical protein
MFSKQDYEEYFRLIEIKEHAILHFLTDTIAHVTDESIIMALKELLRDEAHQYGLSQQLLDYVKELKD